MKANSLSAISSLTARTAHLRFGEATEMGEKGTMPRHIKYSDTVRQLAARAREIAMDRDVLYHGTRYTRSILKTSVLFRSLSGGDPKVCLTRSAEVAAYWSLIDRDGDDGYGSILIFDDLLNAGTELKPTPRFIGTHKELFIMKKRKKYGTT